MIRIAMLIVFIAILAATAVSAGDELPTVEAVLDHFVTAVGGAEILNGVEERHYRGTIVQDLSWKEPAHQETPFLAAADADGHVRYAEVESWAELPAADAKDLRSKLRWIFHPRFALQVEEFFPNLRFSHCEEYQDGYLAVLVPQDLKPEYYSLYFDQTTGLLVQIGYHNWLRDWREVDGVLYPHEWVFGRKGGHTTYVWDEVATGPAPAGD